MVGLVLDSCFKSLSKLVVEIGKQQSEVPALLVKAGYYIIKGTM